jgi:hypothetical protein
MFKKIIFILGVGFSVLYAESFSCEHQLEKALEEVSVATFLEFQDQVLAAPFLTSEDKVALKEMSFFLATKSREEITTNFDRMEVFLGKWDQLDSETKVKCIFFMCLDQDIRTDLKTLLLDPSKALIVFMIIDGAKNLIDEMILLYEFNGWISSTIKLLDLDHEIIESYLGKNNYFELLRYIVLSGK